jgi:rare lipoprotein A
MRGVLGGGEGGGAPDRVMRRATRPAGPWLMAAVVLLAGCTVPPPPPPLSPAATAPTGAGQAGAAAVPGPPLRPLARELSVPPGAPARSDVAAVNYDLSVSSIDDSSFMDDEDGSGDDRVPGDRAARGASQRGGASWYGIQFHQRKTANGERFDMSAFTAAHRTLPFGTAVCVRSLTNGREVLVRINDRGPFSPGRIIDLSRAAAEAIDMVGLGIKQVVLTVIGESGMRCGGIAAPPAAPLTSAMGFGESLSATRPRPGGMRGPR